MKRQGSVSLWVGAQLAFSSIWRTILSSTLSPVYCCWKTDLLFRINSLTLSGAIIDFKFSPNIKIQMDQLTSGTDLHQCLELLSVRSCNKFFSTLHQEGPIHTFSRRRDTFCGMGNIHRLSRVRESKF